MSQIPKFASVDEGVHVLKETLTRIGTTEVALVHNPSYIYSPIEVYPLAPKVTAPLKRLAGVVKDMDGTTTTTEPLCLHGQEWMVRQFTNWKTREDWEGFDRVRDYPHIIGNSTTKHVEYLLTMYGDAFDAAACLEAYLRAAAWTLSQSRDAGRRREVQVNIPTLGLEAILKDAEFRGLAGLARSGDARPPYDAAAVDTFAKRAARELLPRFRVPAFADRVRASMDIYYTRYHVILEDIAAGRGARRAEELLGSPDAHLVEPMPAVGPFLAALKGWLGEDLGLFAEEMCAHVRAKNPLAGEDELRGAKERLAALGRYFSHRPVPVAVVTSSISYEAEIVLSEVFSILRQQIEDWPVSREKKDAILPRFASPHILYDAVITANDSSEIRLKPHRDLYSIALHAMGLTHEDFPNVAGFEDSEAGVTAIRAAGVGLSVAVPFAETMGHDLSAAACILPGQIPEALAVRNCFLDPQVTAANA